jgi:hypothetical protein
VLGKRTRAFATAAEGVTAMSSNPGRSAAIYGAVIANVAVFVLAFLAGAIGGVESPMASGPPPTDYGAAGGVGAVAIVLLVYVGSLGIVPLVVSAVGAALGWGAVRLLGASGSQAEQRAALDRLRDWRPPHAN